MRCCHCGADALILVLHRLLYASRSMRSRLRWAVALGLAFAGLQLYLTFCAGFMSRDLTTTREELLDVPLLERLAIVFPYDPSGGIEKNVIQTAKDQSFTNKEVEMWRALKGFNYTLFDDKAAHRLLSQEFGAMFPEIIEAYNRFPRQILKVDFFRYASIFLLGGTYSDTDTEPLKPMHEWVTFNDTIYGESNNLGLVVGIEAECDCEKWFGFTSRRVQFCQWTLQAKSHHPAYAVLLSNIVNLMINHYDPSLKKVAIAENEYYFGRQQDSYYEGIMELTGPAMFTESLFQYLNSIGELIPTDANDHDEIMRSLKFPTPVDTTLSVLDHRWRHFGWQNVTKISEPVLVSDMLILPQPYFNLKKWTTNSVSLIKHNYEGSWKGPNLGLVVDDEP